MSEDGFFRKEDIIDIPNCSKCGLHKMCRSPRMSHHGFGKRKILVIGQSPGANEDDEGIQFVGDSGKLIDKCLSEYNMELHRDCWTINAVNCRTMDENGVYYSDVFNTDHVYRFGASAEGYEYKFIDIKEYQPGGTYVFRLKKEIRK